MAFVLRILGNLLKVKNAICIRFYLKNPVIILRTYTRIHIYHLLQNNITLVIYLIKNNIHCIMYICIFITIVIKCWCIFIYFIILLQAKHF